MNLLKEQIEVKVEEAELKAEKTFSSFPRIIKWTLIIFAIAILPAYFIAKYSSQFYWQKQYQAYKLQAKASFTNPQPLAVSGLSLISLPNGNLAAAAEIHNENLDLSLPETSYEFKFFNSRQELVSTVSDKIFLQPDQKKFVVVPKVDSTLQPTSVKLEFPAELSWQKRLNLPKVNLSVSTAFYSQSYDPLTFKAEGNFQNQSPYQLGKVRLVFVVYDNSGNIIAVSQRDEFTIKPYERRGYQQLWPGMNLSAAAKVSVFADTNLLDPGNLVLTDQPSTTSSDLSRPEVRPY